MRQRSDHRLVRFARRVPSLERQETTTPPGRVHGPYAFQLQRHTGLPGQGAVREGGEVIVMGANCEDNNSAHLVITRFLFV